MADGIKIGMRGPRGGRVGRAITRAPVDHEHLCAVVPILPTDYADFGGIVERWADPAGSYPDCSGGCRWAVWLDDPFGGDWCVCANPASPRVGLLTFEHQAGHGCFTAGPEGNDDA